MNAPVSKQNLERVRGTDPNVLQRRAADPAASVWVGASAGSGKTKVLTDRVLRLLLPREDGAPGSKPHKILCLTFTKAGAGEMRLRLAKTLRSWAVMENALLEDSLKDLLGRAPDEADIAAARRLFAEVIDSPGGIQIMTIHSFCQSVLARFPLEAGLSPGFQALEEAQAAALLQQALSGILGRASDAKSGPSGQALRRIASLINEEQFGKLMRHICAERHQFSALMRRNFGAEGLYTALCRMLSVPAGAAAEDILAKACADESFARDDLRRAGQALRDFGTESDQAKAVKLLEWLTLDVPSRAARFESYKTVFLKADGDILQRLATKNVEGKNPGTILSLQREGERLQNIMDTIKAAECAIMTRDLLILGQEILEEYQALKSRQGALDFDDLILRTLALLRERPGMAGWVQYKLDQGLDHILVDEAQDTNPEQWQIIEALCLEFFSGAGAQDILRTLFIVGDEKQSIYSFQRAAPEEFARMRRGFSERITQAGLEWRDVGLNISFRSAAAVLDLVDATFADPALRAGLGEAEIAHESFRRGQAGLAEIWPLFESEESGDFDPWETPEKPSAARSGAQALADHLAQKIKNWIAGGEILPSRGRAIEPGDIMVLMRSRTPFVGLLTRALRLAGIPVAGSDRMVLNEQIAVQDLLAAAEFALLHSDDLSLACFLKSPLIGMSEEDLLDLAAPRKGSLWEAVKASPHKEIMIYLSRLIQLAAESGPALFFSHILQSPCPADKISGLRAIRSRLGPDAAEPLEELVSAALRFESTHIPSLQMFLHWQNQESAEIKREMEEAGGAVRIMTVHGAKGLQAPIVIMPDTLRVTSQPPGQSDKRLLWPAQSGLDLPLWAPRKDAECALYATAMENLQSRLDEEYRRLLYVAMTRAEDRLYICGYKGGKNPLENSWYYFAQSGMRRAENHEILEDGIMRLANPQTKEPDKGGKQQSAAPPGITVPDWLFQNAPSEPSPPSPLIPSRPAEAEPAAASPLAGDKHKRFRRGNLTHKLLQILPGLRPERRAEAARVFMHANAADLPAELQNDIIAETLDVLERFAGFFAPGSLAEVPVTGLLADGRVISGQIDRLVVTPETIHILDFKTNRPPPENPDDVPALYRRQMQAYAAALRRIYPGREIRAALLWTDGPFLMDIDVRDV